jgi:hypothetical protein
MTTAGQPPTAQNSLEDSLETQLRPLLEAIDLLAQDFASDSYALLTLLRQIEGLHRSIQDGPFRASLPEDRQRLFDLLQSMERSGGWPYIPRLQLRTFMDLLNREPEGEGSPLPV